MVLTYAEIVKGVIVNTIVADKETGESLGLILLEDGFGLGDLYSRGKFKHAVVREPINPVPPSIERANGKVILIQRGHWQGLLDYVANISDPKKKLIAETTLNDATVWHRESPFLEEASTALGITQKQLDQIFIDASELIL